MEKKSVLLVMALLLCFCAPLLAEQREIGMLNLLAPSGLNGTQGYFHIGHKYYYDMLKYKKAEESYFVPLEAGANADVGFRYMPFDGYGFEAIVGYSGHYSEKIAGMRYTWLLPDAKLRLMTGFDFFSFVKPGIKDARQNCFYFLSAQSDDLFERVSFTLNLGVDGYEERVGLGLGSSVIVIENLRLIGELYFPGGVYATTGASGEEETETENGEGAPQPPLRVGWALGLNYITDGHMFILWAGDTAENGTRKAICADPADTVNIGFKILRQLFF